MQGGGGLRPTSHGKRVRLSGATRTVVNGPFAPTHEQVAGWEDFGQQTSGYGDLETVLAARSVLAPMVFDDHHSDLNRSLVTRPLP
jgi:hypothetical protein